MAGEIHWQIVVLSSEKGFAIWFEEKDERVFSAIKYLVTCRRLCLNIWCWRLAVEVHGTEFRNGHHNLQL